MKIMVTEWLPLTDYSTKYGISVSTLRRRIKAQEIKYRFADGKYLIHEQSDEHRPSQDDQHDAASRPASSTVENIASSLKEQVDGRSEGFSASANRLLGELKKAYAQILQEREEQIINLKEEVVDLKTLVRVLESENDRLQSSVYIYHQSDK